MPFCSFSEGAAMFDVTPIENMFLLEYLPGAPGDALRVYLYARMLCLHPELGDSIGDMARALSMEEDDVQEAFAYWEKRGLVEKMSDRPPTYAVRLLHSETFHAQKVKEAGRYLELRSTVDKLFEERGIVHEKQFRLFLDWIEDLHYTEAAAVKILEFALRQPGGKKPPAVFNRADKLAIEWSDRGIHSLEEVENAIRYEGKVYNLASLVIGQLALNRYATVNELECVRRWMEEYNVTEQDVLEACAETTKSRAPSFAYLDSILQKRNKKDADDAFEQVKHLIDELGLHAARPTPAQMRSYRQWLTQGFAAETILLAAVQCAQKGKHEFQNLDWMLQEWGEAGVHTYAQAQAFLADRQKVKSEAGDVLKRAGLTGEPGKMALSYYEEWKKTHSADLIAYAADCARGKAKALLFMDKLLTDWAANGISTVDGAKARHDQMSAAARNQGGNQNASPVNFEQRSYTKEENANVYFDLEKFFAEEDKKV